MHPCSGCQRFILPRDAACPFCGEIQHQAPSPVQAFVGALLLGAAMLGSGCATDTGSESEGMTTTTSSTTTSESSSESGFGETETDTGDATDDNTESPASFYAPSSDITQINECDPFFQDCPEGEKCVPYGSTGGIWDANKCVMILGDGMPGEECTYDGTAEATDSCGETSLCWNVEDVEGMNIGTCTPFCEGTADNPVCPEFTACFIAYAGSVNVCLDTCDPLMQDCAPDTGCYWLISDFFCLSTTTDQATGASCSSENDCAPGNICAPADALPECESDNCCASFCALDDLEACPEPELSCVPFFDQDPPPGDENIGVCIATPP